MKERKKEEKREGEGKEKEKERQEGRKQKEKRRNERGKRQAGRMGFGLMSCGDPFFTPPQRRHVFPACSYLSSAEIFSRLRLPQNIHCSLACSAPFLPAS